MQLIVDVHYKDNDYAVAAGIAFTDWTSDRIEEKYTIKVDNIAPYKPGSFFERELPCIMALINRIGTKPNVIIIDGYVNLGSEEKDGLGAHLYNALESKIPVIGIAKNRFADTPKKYEVYRGKSKQPLFVTSKGINYNIAKEMIENMHGENRLPTLLKAVDRECRDAIT
jgi:deoxyribonuclease V